MESESTPAKTLPSLDLVRVRLAAPVRPRKPVWTLLLAAMLAAVAGVSVAGVMILGPGDGQPPVTHTAPLSR